MKRTTLAALVALAAVTLALWAPAASADACGECEVENGIGVCELKCDTCANCTLCPNNPGCGDTCGNGVCDADDCTACVEDCTEEQCPGECNDGWCDPEDCLCADGQGDCTIEDCNTQEECRNGVDDDGDGYTDCDDDQCKGSAQCCYGDNTSVAQCSNASGACEESLNVSAGCCSNGEDNDGDGLIDGDDPGCQDYTCEDPCADNYGEAGTDCDQDPNGAPCCTYGGQSSEDEGGSSCCSDGYDNDDDLATDSADSDCDTGCSATSQYASSASCGAKMKNLAGAASDDIAQNSDGSCSATSFLGASIASTITGMGGVCGVALGSHSVSSGTTGVDYFAFSFTATAACPAGQRELPDGTCTSCPIGKIPGTGGGCVCPPNSDNDGDGLCNDQDPCDNLDDTDLSSSDAAAAAGLAESAYTGFCQCASYVRDLRDGASGEDVYTLQDYLAQHGYLDLNVGVTRGIFGYADGGAVYRLQTALGFESPTNIFDQPTREQIVNSEGVRANGGAYNASTNNCDVPPEDLCSNVCHDEAGGDCVENQAWLDTHSSYVRNETTNECALECGAEQKACEATGACIATTECCQPDEFWYCHDVQDCVPNAEACPPVDCEANPGDICCTNPADEGCTACKADYKYCPARQGCFPLGTYDDDCVEGCFPSPVAGRDPYAQVGSYCVTVLDDAGYQQPPWNDKSVPTVDRYWSDGDATCEEGELCQERLDQAAVRAAGQTAYTVQGVVNRAADGASCSNELCDYGERCALYVNSTGRTTAQCVAITCDPCASGTTCPPADPAACTCTAGDPNCCNDNPYAEGCEPVLRGVTIDVVPNVIGGNESCLVLWATAGMASTTLSGADVDETTWHLPVGAMEVSPDQTAIYKISGLGTDGQDYEAVDVCATGPTVSEF